MDNVLPNYALERSVTGSSERAIAVLGGVGIRAIRDGIGENEVLRGRGAMINIYRGEGLGLSSSQPSDD